MSGGYHEDGWPAFLAEAAEQARAESARRPAGKRHPIPEEWWPTDSHAPWADNQDGLFFQSRFREAARMAGVLIAARSIDPAVALDLLWCWNLVHARPPIAKARLRRTFAWVARREIARLEMCR